MDYCSHNSTAMEQSDIGLNLHCLGCFASKEEKSLYCLNLQNSVFKIVIQMENSTLQSARTHTGPYQLSSVRLDIIEVGFEPEEEKDQKNVYDDVKLEMKEDSAPDHYQDDNSSQESFDKESSLPLNVLLKEEKEVVKTPKERSPKKTPRKYKKRKKKNDEEEDELAIIPFEITREQCFEERARMALDQRYLASTYKCTDCVKGFNYKDSFDKHMEKHSESNGNYECDVCKQRMSTEEKFVGHKKYHEKRYRCPVCGMTRASRVLVKDHYSAFHSSHQTRHNCPHCEKTFTRKLAWRKHVSSVHGRARETCQYCKKTYANKDALRSHINLRHPIEGTTRPIIKSHICQDCGKAFRSPSLLKIHSVKHSNNKDYYCVECDKSFKTSTILKHHLKTASVHVNYVDLPLACEHCGKRFAIRRDLEQHINRVHLNIKPFQCDRCEKAYVNVWSLNEHRRIAHEGFKRPLKFPCSMCDKVFDSNNILKDHIRTHTGERPFQCSRCPAQFRQPALWGLMSNLCISS
ncbi:oocyte zinc finger protein XlCOF6-like isoform X2 [Leguminivora glycinivorella]|uniref:oocyte zinc finger protein XlCOF6-like isoform X2 n=1 Tax=Leguminivora glycinivorella TaxID=1035111 RepID=UPI00200D7B86|nr:oocyte zinc finger protein XlCOF6-like isoform X2 [Leguminivora glycinivorella]